MFSNVFSKQNRALLAELVRTDFKLRYQGSALGYAWSLLRPLLLFLILYVVFVRFLKFGKGIAHYPVYLLLGIVIWNFFLEMTTRSLTAIVERGDLLRKIFIPRWVIIVSTSLSALINLILNLIVVLLFLFINHVDLLRTSLLFPLILCEVYILALGLSLLLSATYVRYRDITYIWEVLMQAAFYITPIIYPISLISSLSLRKLLLINPMAQAIQDSRYALIGHQTETTAAVFGGGPLKFVPYLIPLFVLWLGIWYFKKESPGFAENV